MSEPETTPRPAPRSPILPLAGWLLSVAAIFVAVAAGMSFVARSLELTSPAGADEGDARPPADFRLATLEGGELGPADFAGDVVLIEFWATWCGPCKLQAKLIDKLHHELDGQGIHFLAINVGEDAETVGSYVAERPFPYPVLLDPEDSLGPRYQIYGLPTVMIVDREGAVTFLETGVSPAERLRHELRRAGAKI